MGRRNASAVGTLVERTTRATLLVPLRAKDARAVRLAFARELRTLPQQLRQSMTYDQGTEMAEHRLFTKATRMRVYFAHPHSPWERGTNENTNSLIRQCFPKGTDFSRGDTATDQARPVVVEWAPPQGAPVADARGGLPGAVALGT